ncbi:MAG: acyl-[acyl-carrier-protein] thioesterase [Lachnospiraceae bacterium]|nr:acyl-[acyl-carrier-protein] thioesterase [Lachnospiraceae bacterium]
MYEYRKRIGFSECGTDRIFTVTSLIDAFQDCSTFQSEDAGAGFDVLAAQKLLWVINYWEIEIDRLPKLCEYVTVGTFPYSFKGCFGLRNFYLKDEGGQYIVKANSMWTLINIDNAHPVKAPDFIHEAYTIEPKLSMSYSTRKVLIPEGGDVTCEKKDPIRIQRHHLDSNNHMNNGQYVKLAMSELGRCSVSSLRIDYRQQAKLNDEIFPAVYAKGNERCVALYDVNGKPYSVSQFMLREG